MKHLIDLSQITRSLIQSLIQNADKMKHQIKMGITNNSMRGKTLLSLYYQPSMRTMCSFQSAMIKLGGSNITISNPSSSVENGESLEDTIMSLNCYGDAIVMSHYKNDSSKIAASVSNIPIINAGDGNDAHPTQALLDIYTIYCELGTIGGKWSDSPMRVLFLGDLKNSRNVHSLIQLLSMFENIEFIYISPDGLEIPDKIKQYISGIGINQITVYHLLEAIRIADVVYTTRIQTEKIESNENINVKLLSLQYQITPDILSNAKPSMILMHPFPRSDEILPEVDSDSKAVYFKQMEYGVYMRMAILDWVINKQFNL